MGEWAQRQEYERREAKRKEYMLVAEAARYALEPLVHALWGVASAIREAAPKPTGSGARKDD